MVPMDEVAMGFPELSKAKMDEAGPLSKFHPIVEEAMTAPEELPARSELAGARR